VGFEPSGDLDRVEADVVADFYVRDLSFEHQASQVPHGVVEPFGELIVGQQLVGRRVVAADRGRGSSLALEHRLLIESVGHGPALCAHHFPKNFPIDFPILDNRIEISVQPVPSPASPARRSATDGRLGITRADGHDLRGRARRLLATPGTTTRGCRPRRSEGHESTGCIRCAGIDPLVWEAAEALRPGRPANAGLGVEPDGLLVPFACRIDGRRPSIGGRLTIGGARRGAVGVSRASVDAHEPSGSTVWPLCAVLFRLPRSHGRSALRAAMKPSGRSGRG
jgi:hypothetical protein